MEFYVQIQIKSLMFYLNQTTLCLKPCNLRGFYQTGVHDCFNFFQTEIGFVMADYSDLGILGVIKPVL
jgi:hypothetical protein